MMRRREPTEPSNEHMLTVVSSRSTECASMLVRILNRNEHHVDNQRAPVFTASVIDPRNTKYKIGDKFSVHWCNGRLYCGDKAPWPANAPGGEGTAHAGGKE